MKAFQFIFLYFLATTPTWADNFQYSCKMKVVNNRTNLGGDVNVDFAGGAATGLTLGDYSLSVKKENLDTLETMQIILSSVTGEMNAAIVPLGMPWAMLVLNPRPGHVVQAKCTIKS